tara:strand:- start:122 stop:517 length:396 start_codon:yes stop_codon:yes gene_type:complete
MYRRERVFFMLKNLFVVIFFCLALGTKVNAEALSSDQIVEKDGISYSTLTNEPYDGSVINFFSNGQLDYKGSFKNGKKEGIWVGYYLDGQLRFKGRYKNGKRHGRWETKTKYGQKKRWQSGMFKDDIRVSD